MITLFNKLGQQLFADGRVYVAIPPLYRIVFNNGKVEYCEDDAKLIVYLINRVLASKQHISGKTSGVDISKTELNLLFNDLFDLTSLATQTITITGCTGAATCNKTIATNKNWTVIG